MVADTVRTRDKDLPTFFCESQSLGDSHDDAQPDRRRGFFISRCVHNEGQGNLLLRDIRCHGLAISVPASISSRSAILRRFKIRFRTGLYRHSIQKIFQGVFSSQFSRVMRPEAAFPQSDAHRLSLATDLPAPQIPAASRSRNGDVE
jgi:hypothetical protein